MVKRLSYSQSGVDYSAMDPVKVLAQQQAAATSSQLKYHGASEVSESRGESAYVWEEKDSYKAFVVEGLGTKNRVAHEVRKLSGKTYYDQIAQDTVAMIVNDLIVVGALPQVVNAYWALGDSAFLNDEQRTKDLINGWAAACKLAGAAWGGGETPTLKGTIEPDTIDLAGAAIGTVANKKNLVLGDKLAAGDKIILIESTGIHANGLTLARSIAEKLPEGYATKLPDGSDYGEALLKPTHIYAKLVKSLQQAAVDIHYMVHITGHGWRKLMRATQEFTYVMDFTPEVPEVFSFVQAQTNSSFEEMYGNFNMGAGFAVYVPEKYAEKIVELAKAQNMKAWIAGTVEEGPKQVVIKPKNIIFEEKSLGVR
jgi:phosphoribosylformylglycinamidine cyclo-ligase